MQMSVTAIISLLFTATISSGTDTISSGTPTISHELGGQGGARSLSLSRVRVSETRIKSGDSVIVSWENAVTDAKGSTEYICTQDSFCQNKNLSAWVGLFDATRTPRKLIGPQRWPCANPPWIDPSPIKWKPIEVEDGETRVAILGHTVQTDGQLQQV